MTTATGSAAASALSAVIDTERLKIVEQTGLLTGAADDALDRLARLAAALVGAPSAYVSLVARDRQVFAGMAQAGSDVGPRSEPISDSFCKFAVATGEPLVIPDTRANPLTQATAAARESKVGAYAGIPLSTAQGTILGTLCVVDPEARPWGDRELGLLQDLTLLAAQQIDVRLTARHYETVQATGQRLVRQITETVDVVSSLVDQAEHRDDALLQRFAALTRSRVTQLTAANRKLEAVLNSEQGRQPAPGVAQADLRQVVQRAAGSARAATGNDKIILRSVDAALPILCDPHRLEQSVTHLLITSLQYATARTVVTVDLTVSATPTEDAIGAVASANTATLQVTADASHIPAGELARVVARVHAAALGADDRPASPAALRVIRGVVTARSGPVRGESSPAKGSRLWGSWPLSILPSAPAVIQLS